MVSVSLPRGTVCLILLVSVVSPQPTFLLPQQRSEASSPDVLELEPYNAIEYHQLVPGSEYAVAAVPSTELSIFDYILSPFTAVTSLGSTALSVISWVIIKGSLVFLGMAIVIGFCALTPYCTLTIEKPAFLARKNLSTFPYLEDLEYFFSEAYSKYQEMQNSV